MDDLNEIKKIILPILNRYGVKKAAVFGSAARGEMTKDSDIDILVEIKKDLGLFEFVHLNNELEDALGKKVDLVEYETIKPRLRDIILREQLAIL